jgi:D-alanine-D-alanine ligase
VDWCLKLFERLECRDYARFDWRLDAKGTPKLLEVNPNPGWCWDGHLAKMAAITGMSYKELLEAVLKTAEARMLHLHKNERATVSGINKVSESGE